MKRPLRKAWTFFYPATTQGRALCLASSLLLCSQVAWAVELQENTPLDLSETGSLFAALFKVSGALAVVIGLMLALIYLFKRSGLQNGLQGASQIKVLDSKMVAPKKYIAIIDIAGKKVVVGIADNALTLLSELDPEQDKRVEDFTAKPQSPFAFADFLQKARGQLFSKKGTQ